MLLGRFRISSAAHRRSRFGSPCDKILVPAIPLLEQSEQESSMVNPQVRGAGLVAQRAFSIRARALFTVFSSLRSSRIWQRNGDHKRALSWNACSKVSAPCWAEFLPAFQVGSQERPSVSRGP